MNSITTVTAATVLEKELESKQKEFCDLQEQCKQLQELLLELPVVKKELHKSKQDTKAINELLFQSRRNNAELKDHVGKLNKQIKDFETITEQHRDLQNRLQGVTNERDKNACEIQRLCSIFEDKDEEVQRNRAHCTTLKGLVDRLEVR